ncbi:MAG: transketolase [Propionivibrio sp.]|nr:transketolase [Propionivibrio sp.]
MVSQASLANAIRVLTMDSVQAANSGHPGAPMGMAEMALALWSRHLKHNPADPAWPDRDRFVLSNGHGSMLLYALLHLTGYDLPLDELKNFRQLHSKTPGHPEYGLTAGVETTTGPLGQGIGNSVGLALAEKLLAIEFNREGFAIVDHYNYVFVGDGCLMEGISHEVCSLAGTWKLSKLIAFFDDNGMSIDGAVEGWFTDDTPRRFEAYGWNVIRGVDGHDVDAVDLAICAAKSQHDKPTLICCKTVIGKGSPNKAGTLDAHGAALGKDEVAATRVALGITEGAFEVPEAVRAAWDGRAAGATRQAEWQALFAAYRAAHPKLATEFVRRMKGELHPEFSATAAEALQAIVSKNEAIAMNGLVLHGGFRPFGGTYLMFSEYARNAIRMAALMRINPIFIFTHDSVGVGEDGPTHQPIEQAATLRMVPNLDVWRPCNSVETFVAWQIAIEHRSTPSALILTRQNLPHLAHHSNQTSMIRRGGYVLKDCSGAPKAVIIATGSEVCVALDAQQALAEKGIAVRVVSLPSSFVFDQQDVSYRESVLPRGVPRVAVEAGVTGYWRQYVGLEGAVVGIDRFGESAPVSQVFEYFGITAAAVLTAVEGVIAG